MSIILAFDLGTSGLKASLVHHHDGHLIDSATAPYPTQYSPDGAAEQRAEDWWAAVCSACALLRERNPEALRAVEGIGCTGMMNGVCLIDARGDTVRPVMIHADTRGRAQSEYFEQAHGLENIVRRTQNRPDCHLSLPKLMWLQEHEPESLARAAFVVQAKDYLVMRLTGTMGVTDPSDASLTGSYSVVQREWASDLWQSAGIDVRLLPRVMGSTAVAGVVSESAAQETGIRSGTPVVAGGGDGPCATAGSGTQRGGGYVYLGGTAWTGMLSDAPVADSRLSHYCALGPGVTVFGTVQAAGSSVDWARSVLDVPEGMSAADLDLQVLARAAAARGPLFLPYLQGERAPLWDPDARGLYFGLASYHDALDLYGAVIEGVAFALRSIVDVFTENGLEATEMRLLGTAARSPLWQRTLADSLSRPVHVLRDVSTATSLGAAMAAAVGVGLHESIRTAGEAMTQLDGATHPHADNGQRYALFQALYQRLMPAYKELASMEGRY